MSGEFRTLRQLIRKRNVRSLLSNATACYLDTG